MENLSRRTFTKKAIASVLTYSLLEALCTNDLFADEIKPVTRKWAADLNRLARDVKDDKIKQLEWQKHVELLLAKVDLPDLLRLIDFDRITKGVKLIDNGARSIRFKFKEIDGVPTRLVFGRQIFALKKDRSVVPHGHNNMATAFLILKGEFEGKHYDRLEDEPKHMIIRPTIDRKFGPGECSSVSDYKDNVHWFKARNDGAFIFNLHILGLKRPGTELRTGRVYVDPAGEKLKGGRIRARLIDSREAHKKYG